MEISSGVIVGCASIPRSYGATLAQPVARASEPSVRRTRRAFFISSNCSERDHALKAKNAVDQPRSKDVSMHLGARSGMLSVMRRVALASAVVAAFVAAVTVACTTDYQKGLDDPNFGGPNALAGQKQPGATTEVLTTPAG